MIRLGIGKLDPIAKHVLRDPEDLRVDTLTSLLLVRLRLLFLEGQLTGGDPVVALHTINLTEETESGGTAHHGEALERLLHKRHALLAEVDTGPFEHGSVPFKVGNENLLVHGQKRSVHYVHLVRLLAEERLRNLDSFQSLLVCKMTVCLGDLAINLVVIFGVLAMEISMLDENADFFELLISIVGMVLHDATEDLSQVRVEVGCDVIAKVLFGLQLRHDIGKLFAVCNAHFVPYLVFSRKENLLLFYLCN